MSCHAPSGKQMPWRSASELSRLRLKRLVRLVRPDAHHTIFFFPDVISFGVESCFSRGGTREVACFLVFGLGVYSRDKLGCSGLPYLGFLLQVLPSFNVGGVYGMFGWCVWLSGGCFGSISIPVGAGAVVGRWAVDIVVLFGSSLPLPLSLFLWFGTGVAWAPSRLGGGGWAVCGREELLLHQGDSGAQHGNLLGQAVCGVLKVGVVFGKELGDHSAHGCGESVEEVAGDDFNVGTECSILWAE